ncbi:MAG: GNAT family N-acetyltransferase [Rhizobiaceae bacterium]
MIKPAIRRATRDDFPAVVRMIHDLATHSGAPERPKISIDVLEADGPLGHDRFRILVAELDGAVVGLCLYTFAFSGWFGKTGLFIEDLYVDPSARGIGAGQALLTAAADLESAGFFKLEVAQANEQAVAFYRKAGFTIWDGELLMARDLA